MSWTASAAGEASEAERVLNEWSRLRGRVLAAGVERGWAVHYGRSVEELTHLLSECSGAAEAASPRPSLEHSGGFEAPELFDDDEDSEDAEREEDEQGREDDARQPAQTPMRGGGEAAQGGPSSSSTSIYSGHSMSTSPFTSASLCSSPSSPFSVSPSPSAGASAGSERCSPPPLLFPRLGCVTGRSEQRLRRQLRQPPSPASPSSPPPRTLHPPPLLLTPVSDTLRSRTLDWRSDSDGEVEEGTAKRGSDCPAAVIEALPPSHPPSPPPPTTSLSSLPPTTPHRHRLSAALQQPSDCRAAAGTTGNASGGEEEEKEPGMSGSAAEKSEPGEGEAAPAMGALDEAEAAAELLTRWSLDGRRRAASASPADERTAGEKEEEADGDREGKMKPGLCPATADRQRPHSRAQPSPRMGEEEEEEEGEQSPAFPPARQPMGGRRRRLLVEEEEEEDGECPPLPASASSAKASAPPLSAAPTTSGPLYDVSNQSAQRGRWSDSVHSLLSPPSKAAAQGSDHQQLSPLSSGMSGPRAHHRDDLSPSSVRSLTGDCPHVSGAVSQTPTVTVTRSSRTVGWTGWQQPQQRRGGLTFPSSASLRDLIRQRKHQLMHSISSQAGTHAVHLLRQQPHTAAAQWSNQLMQEDEEGQDEGEEGEEEGEGEDFDWIVDDERAGDGSEDEGADEEDVEEQGEEEAAECRVGDVGDAVAAVASSPSAVGRSRARLRVDRSPSSSSVQRLTSGNRDAVARATYEWLNSVAFSAQLPSSLPLVWSAKLNSTAGLCSLLRPSPSTRAASIRLATKVLDSGDKLRLTLAHEMCHAAAWIIDGCSRPPHGHTFRRWAAQVEARVEGLSISTCHRYSIHYKWRWQCSHPWCGAVVGRHSDSLDVERVQCAQCGGRFVPLGRFTRNGRPAAEREGRGGQRPPALNGFAAFVQTFYAPVKKETGRGTPHKEVMAELSRRYREEKSKATPKPPNERGPEGPRQIGEKPEEELVQRVLQLQLEEDDELE